MASSSKVFKCLVEGCDVTKKVEKEWKGHMILRHYQRAEKIVDERTKEIRWELCPAEEKEAAKAWQDVHKLGAGKWDEMRWDGVIDAWGRTLKKAGWQKGKTRANEARV